MRTAFIGLGTSGKAAARLGLYALCRSLQDQDQVTHESCLDSIILFDPADKGASHIDFESLLDLIEADKPLRAVIAALSPEQQADLARRGLQYCTTELPPCDLGVISPGISVHSEIYRDADKVCAQIIGELEYAYRLAPSHLRWLGITGTNGKTTTTALLTQLMCTAGYKAQAVGNIGLACSQAVYQELVAQDAALGALEESMLGGVKQGVRGKREQLYLIAELSSFQLCTSLSFAPAAAALLNVTPDHLEWHGSHEHYLESKLKIFQFMEAGSLAVLHLFEEETPRLVESLSKQGLKICLVCEKHPGQLSTEECERIAHYTSTYPELCWATLNEAAELCLGKSHQGTQVLLPAADLKIKGQHNVANALVASAMAWYEGASLSSLQEGLISFTAPEHRIEYVDQVAGVKYYNDSKATNIDAARQALTAFADEDLILMLGGHDKGADLSQFAQMCVGTARVCVCFGEAAGLFYEALTQAQAALIKTGRSDEIWAEEILCAQNLEQGFRAAHTRAHEGSVVLLSPACSSFDEFENYEERGRYFKDLVRSLLERK